MRGFKRWERVVMGAIFDVEKNCASRCRVWGICFLQSETIDDMRGFLFAWSGIFSEKPLRCRSQVGFIKTSTPIRSEERSPIEYSESG